MTIEVETPQGVVEFPDGTDPETMRRVLRRMNEPPIPQPSRGAPLALGPEPVISPTQAREELRGGARIGALSAAATAGGELGAPLGPAGMLGGALLGVAAGSVAFDNVNQALEAMGLRPLPGGAEGTGLERVQQSVSLAAEEMRTEALFTGGFSLIFPVRKFLTPLMGKVLGVRGQGARTMRDLARRQGIELSAVDIGGPVAKGFSRVLGIFPFTGSPLRKFRDVKEAQISGRVNQILDEVAPTATLSGEVGVDLLQAAQKSDARFRQISAQMYDRFRDAARGLKDAEGNIIPVIPTNQTKDEIARFVEEARLGEVPLVSEEVQVLKGGVPEGFEQFLKDAEALPSHLTYDQWRRLQNQLEGFVDKLTPDPFTVKRVAQIKQAMEADLNDIGNGIEVATEQLEAIRALKQDADTFFSNGIVVFQTPTAARFGRVDKRIFKAGPEKAGTLNPDELMKPVFNVDSPQALRDLRGLVGDEAFNRAARAHLDDAVAKSFKVDRRGGEDIAIFDLDEFSKNLGLVKGMKDRSEAVREMLKGTGVELKDLQQLVENARVAKISDPATFVTRRVTLGGVAALGAMIGVGGAGAAGGVLGAPVSTIALTLLSRHGSRILADPKRLDALQTAFFSPTLDEVKRRALLLRLVRQLEPEEDTRSSPRAPPPGR